jgi:hypothetical protein
MKCTTDVSTDVEWELACEFHLARLREQMEQGYADAAGRHAQALVHMALDRRAAQVMRDLGRAYWKAILVARHELCDCEVV